jgi:hypothetical protein
MLSLTARSNRSTCSEQRRLKKSSPIRLHLSPLFNYRAPAWSEIRNALNFIRPDNRQNINFKASCRIRGLFAEVICPVEDEPR